MRVVDPYSFKIYSVKIDETRMGAGSKWCLSGRSWESLQSTFGKGSQCQSLETICWNRSGARSLQKRYIHVYLIDLSGRMSVEQFQGCRWNNFTDEWNAQLIVSKVATKLRKHIQKRKIECLFKALSLTIALKMLSWFSLMLWWFGNLLNNGTTVLVQLLRKMRGSKRPWKSSSYIHRHVQLTEK